MSLDSLLLAAMVEVEQGHTRSSPGDNHHFPRSSEIATEPVVRVEPVLLMSRGFRDYLSRLVPDSFSEEVLVDVELKEGRAERNCRRGVFHTAQLFHLHRSVPHDGKLGQMDHSS